MIFFKTTSIIYNVVFTQGIVIDFIGKSMSSCTKLVYCVDTYLALLFPISNYCHFKTSNFILQYVAFTDSYIILYQENPSTRAVQSHH